MDSVVRYLHLLKNLLDAFIKWRTEHPPEEEPEDGEEMAAEAMKFNPKTGTYERAEQ